MYELLIIENFLKQRNTNKLLQIIVRICRQQLKCMVIGKRVPFALENMNM